MLGPSSVVPPASDEEDRTPGGKLRGKRFLGGWTGANWAIYRHSKQVVAPTHKSPEQPLPL